MIYLRRRLDAKAKVDYFVGLQSVGCYLIAKLVYIVRNVAHARVVKLVDTLDLGSSAFGHGGSTPPSRTRFIKKYAGRAYEPAYFFNIILIIN